MSLSLGSFVKLPDGREGTVTFNGLIGVGIKWGRHHFNPAIFKGSVADLGMIGVTGPKPSEELEALEPDALLRESWPNAPYECVGEDYEVLTP